MSWVTDSLTQVASDGCKADDDEADRAMEELFVRETPRKRALTFTASLKLANLARSLSAVLSALRECTTSDVQFRNRSLTLHHQTSVSQPHTRPVRNITRGRKPDEA